ncbi:MAG: ABC transporter permease [Acidobacteria bacterium]|nr:ABC transporter permease [Acidobacteriota bacterium]
MNLRRLVAVARKEALHVLRDPRSLGFAFLIPMLLLILFGFALTLDVDHVPIVVWDQSHTAASRELVARFAGSRYFTLTKQVDRYKEIEHDLDTGQALCALIIPRDYARNLVNRRSATVQFLLDGSDANTGSLALGYAESVVSSQSESVMVKEARRKAPQPPRPPLEPRPRVWYNPDLESRNLIIPGQIAVIMVVLASLLTSLTFAREWENGTMEQLVSTPVTGAELVMGKLLPYVIIGLADVGIAMLATRYVFEVTMRGNALLLLALAFVFLVGALAMGMLISILLKSQLLASQLSMMVTYLPAILLSGLVFAIKNMPAFVQYLTYLFPARYFMSVIKGIYLKGLGLEEMGGEVVLLLVFATAMVLLCILRFRKRIA